MTNDTVKLPLGLMPEFIHKENRYREIHAAIKRYVDANKDVPADWLRECKALSIYV